MDLLKKYEAGFKGCCEELRELKRELDESERHYQEDRNSKNYVSKELQGTLNFDYFCECMLDRAQKALRDLGLDLEQAPSVVYAVTGVRV